jgi:uncharacterized protein YdeI (YjbR/CyaY-like superfamily)|tara:strand:+ start:78 stop:269 length:192 start_codon:yes stop_codon:yes gene_type:complete
MSRSIALGMLRQGNTGNEILQILDVIVADIVEQNNIVLQKLNDAISAQSDGSIVDFNGNPTEF